MISEMAMALPPSWARTTSFSEECIADGNTDAGFDLKSNDVTLLRCESYGNTANFKLWGKENVVMQECVSENPVQHGGNQKPKSSYRSLGSQRPCEEVPLHRPKSRRNGVSHRRERHIEAAGWLDDYRHRIGRQLSSGRLSFVDLNSRVFIDGAEQPFDGR